MKSRFRNWSDVRIFLAVIRAGSTLGASRRLGIAQPTVARRIEALEHEMGLVLFDRDNRGFRPTAAAQALLPLAQSMEAAALALEERAQDLQRPRPIRITAFSPNFSARVSDIFTAFSERHPDVAFAFLPGGEILDLAKGEADIALRVTRTQPDPDLICRKISTAHFTLFGAPAYARAHGLPTSPEEMGEHVLVDYVPHGGQSFHHDWLARHVPPDRIVAIYGEFGLLEAAIRAGRGLGVINLRLAEADEASGRLIRCFPPPEALSADHLMLVAPEAYRRPDVRAFTRFFAPRYAAIFR